MRKEWSVYILCDPAPFYVGCTSLPLLWRVKQHRHNPTSPARSRLRAATNLSYGLLFSTRSWMKALYMERAFILEIPGLVNQQRFLCPSSFRRRAATLIANAGGPSNLASLGHLLQLWRIQHEIEIMNRRSSARIERF